MVLFHAYTCKGDTHACVHVQCRAIAQYTWYIIYAMLNICMLEFAADNAPEFSQRICASYI